MPNIVAYAMLLIWPVVALILFTRLPRAQAIVWTMLAGILLLPAETRLDPPMLPALDKHNAPVLAAVALCLLGIGAGRVRRRARAGAAAGAPPAPEALPGWLPASRMACVLAGLMVFTPMVTALLNSAPITFEATDRRIPGLRPYDGLSGIMNHAVLLLPFLLGRKFLGRAEDMRLLLRAFLLAGLAYSLAMIFEMRMSPQLHNMVYGFFPHSFAQTRRLGGWRPQVFMEHGLRAAIFTAMFCVAAVALWRTTAAAARMRNGLAALWLAVVLVFTRSVGAIVLGAGTALAVALAGRRTQIWLAAGLAVAVVAYPMLRGAGVVPVQTMVSLAGAKGGSLEYRFDNEDILLDKAAERALFGWGPWARFRVFDPVTGEDISTTDGTWIITIGEFGWLGYLGKFGLLALPVVALFLRRTRPEVTLEVTALCLILCINLVDLLPNSSLNPITWLLAGALLGRVERITRETGTDRPAARRRAGRARPAQAAPAHAGAPARAGPRAEARRRQGG